jgi:hypothetical protein
MNLNKQNLSEQWPSNTKEERKAIVFEYYKEFQKKYPNFLLMSENYCMPEPKKPPILANVDISKKQMASVAINELQKSVLCGTCFSDSSISIQPKYSNARVNNRHCTRQYVWFFWKWMVCLKDFTNGINSVNFQNPDGYQKKAKQTPSEMSGPLKLGKLKIASLVSPQLTELNAALSSGYAEERKPRKKIARNWLNHMTDYFLMTIWLDDGGLHSRNSSGCISWNSVLVEDQKIFVNYLKKVWNINARTAKLDKKMANGQYMYRIVFVDQENLLKFLRIVAPIIPIREMLYKIQFVPVNNTDLLQRWASEVTELVLPEFRDEMRDFYSKVLSNYPNYPNSEEDIVQ